MDKLPSYKEVTTKKLALMTDSEKIEEMRKAHNWLRENYINDDKAINHNYHVYIYFADIVQRLIESD